MSWLLFGFFSAFAVCAVALPANEKSFFASLLSLYLHLGVSFGLVAAMSSLDELLNLSLEDKHIIAEYIWYGFFILFGVGCLFLFQCAFFRLRCLLRDFFWGAFLCGEMKERMERSESFFPLNFEFLLQRSDDDNLILNLEFCLFWFLLLLRCL